MRAVITMGGSGAFASWGAMGFFAGPVVGAFTTATGFVVGAIAGYMAAPMLEKCCDATEKAVDNADRIVNVQIPNAVTDLSIGVKKFTDDAGKLGDNAVAAAGHGKEIVGRIGHIISTAHGVGLLGVGLLLGAGLWKIGVECNPTCTNLNAELVRYAAIILSASGVAVVGYSTLRAVF